MHCRTCNKELSDQAVICPQCGCAPAVGREFCQNCGAATNPMAEMCITCGVLLARGVPGQNVAGQQLKSKMAAGLLGIFLGGFGVHRFYLGFTTIGIVQIVVTIVTCGIGAIWGLIEGILILTGNINQDAQGRPLAE